MRERLEEKLVNEAGIFSTVFESVEQGILLFKVIRDSSNQIIDFEYILVNRWAELLLGNTRTYLIGKRQLEEYPYLKDVGVFDSQVKVIETGESIKTDFYYGFQGLNKWYKNGMIKISETELIVTFDDITKQKEADIELENLQSIILQSQALGKIGSYEWNFVTRKLTLSPEMIEILCSGTIKNIDAITLETHPFEEFIHPDDREKADQTIKKAIFDHQPYDIEYKILCPGNLIKYVWSRGKVFYNNQGKPIKIISTVLDISEWKRSKHEIQKKEILLTLAEGMANLGSYEFDIENKSAIWSDQLFRIYGYEPNEFEPKEDNLFMMVHPEDKDYIKELFTETVFHEDEFEYEFKFMRKDSSPGVSYGKARVIRNENNQIIKITGFVQDITEKVKILEQL
ncbi:PAS domain-containing protein [Sporocytophaga myxococcoides]|nr:PAS domain-containing protein [Sporocytophaga myxococcoides]